jgi:catechol 2,3-dioxygenase-like lactoylglutathione lyase family enzyme
MQRGFSEKGWGMGEKIRFEGLTLSVENIERSLAFYQGKLGFAVPINAGPDFALIRVGAGTIGLLGRHIARQEGIADATAQQNSAIHVEFSTDDLDGLYEELKAKGVEFAEPPHDEPWERSMTAYDPDGYTVEFAQGLRGENQPGENQAGR